MRKLCSLLLLVLFLFPTLSFADLNISISGIVTGGSGPSPDADSSSGGSSNLEIAPTDVTFSGLAYPNAKVFLLSGGILVSQTTADTNALFSLKLPTLSPGVKIFSIIAEDIKGTRSILLTLPITISGSTSTTISKLFIPPTLSIDKLAYSRGEDVLVGGYSAPNAKVTINLDSKNNTDSLADKIGFYSNNIKTDSLLLGNHTLQAKSQVVLNDLSKESGLGKITSFILALNKDVKIEDKSNLAVVADINNDSVINITDFSVLAFWFSKSNVPKNIDINGDGKITIADFSILAYYWNG